MATAGTYSSANGICTYSGWSGVAPSGGLTLSFDATLSVSGDGGGSAVNSARVTADGSNYTTLFSSTSSAAQTHYTFAIPGGTNLANIKLTFSSLSTASQTSASDGSGSIVVANLKIS